MRWKLASEPLPFWDSFDITTISKSTAFNICEYVSRFLDILHRNPVDFSMSWLVDYCTHFALIWEKVKETWTRNMISLLQCEHLLWWMPQLEDFARLYLVKCFLWFMNNLIPCYKVTSFSIFLFSQKIQSYDFVNEIEKRVKFIENMDYTQYWYLVW